MYRERFAKSVTPKSIALTDRFRQTHQRIVRFDMGARYPAPKGECNMGLGTSLSLSLPLRSSKTGVADH